MTTNLNQIFIAFSGNLALLFGRPLAGAADCGARHA
jgi:hypothetical protein